MCKTFSSLRQEEHLFDVTLVSDDEKHISAHKLVLSASSELFKNMIKKVSHSNPMIFLSGFKANDLLLVMDYIYQGEVQVMQSDLDGFLDVAHRLKIEGLIAGHNASADESNNFRENIKEEPSYLTEEQYYDAEKRKENVNGLAATKKIQRAERSIAIVNSNMDAKAAVSELVEKTDEGWSCKQCGKMTKTNTDIRKHAEIHIDGLSFDCQLCHKTFRSKRALKAHKETHHI